MTSPERIGYQCAAIVLHPVLHPSDEEGNREATDSEQDDTGGLVDIADVGGQ